MMIEVHVLMARPVDPAQLPPDLLKVLPPAMIDDTIRPCDRCRRECWVAPRKLLLNTLTGAPVWCYVCLLDALGSGLVQPGSFVNLNPDREEVPRVGALR